MTRRQAGAPDGPRAEEAGWPLAWLGPALLGFWSAYFGIVALSNLTDLLRGLGVLPPTWGWVSGNLAFIAAATAKLGPSTWLGPVLLAGVVAWQALAAGLFARAVRRAPVDASLAAPFGVSLALWGLFVLLDEALLIFETGVEATHLRLLGVELLSLLVIRATRTVDRDPARAGRPGDAAAGRPDASR